MLRLISPLLLILATAVPCLAQSTASPSAPVAGAAADSLRAVQDSILARASAIVAVDSAATDEFERIVTIHKERKRFALQLQAAMSMAAANPRSALAHLLLGDALLDNDQPERALEELRSALAIEPTYVRARVILAETYDILHQSDSALVHLDTALRHNPRHAQAHMQRARLLVRRARMAEAVAHYRIACELLPDNPSAYGPWMKLAETLMATSAYDEAIEALTYCTRLRPTAADPWLLIAEAQEKAGRIDAAIAAYNDFARRFSSDARALDAERSALRLRFSR